LFRKLSSNRAAAPRARLRNNCSGCHSSDYISTQPQGPKFKKDFWQAEVTKMIKVYGVPIDEADAGKIVDYLAATY
jgi:sulfite dehydrogenase (cytochrome) subunit B